MNGSSLIAFRCAICCAISLALLSAFTTRSNAQQPGPTPSPTPSPHEEQEPIRTLIEEIQLPVAVFDNRGQPDPTLELDDIMVLEDGIPQQIRSARRVPASVLLLLDTGGETNSAKSIPVTRAIARQLVSALGSRDQISVMQFNNRVELLQDWTTDRKQVLQVLDTKLLSGKRAHFSEAILIAANWLSDRPVGNRHLVMITDGVETPGGRVRRTEALRRLTESNTTVHVISYTVVSLHPIKQAERTVTRRDKSTVPDEVVNTLPDDPGYEQLRRLHKPGGITVDLDPDRRRQIREYEAAMRDSEWQLVSLTQETGGHLWLPESFDEMIADGAETAHVIDSEYIVTYKPKRPLASSRAGEIRRISVVSRRVGLNVVARRYYVVPAKL
jgi:VWFA-related protein